MNRLVYVHGRAQAGRSSAEIEEEWTGGLQRGFAAVGATAPGPERIAAPFYGDTLEQLTQEAEFSLVEVLLRGAEPERPRDEQSPDIDEWDVEFLREVLAEAGVGDDEIRAQLDGTVTERAPWNWEWVQAIGRAADEHLPTLSNLTMWQLTRDVRTYLSRPSVQQAVHAIVRPSLEAGRCVVVAHSLGSIVAYQLLTEMAGEADVALLVTAGSPLGGRSVQRRLDWIGMPAGVDAWLNVTDPRDPVAIRDTLGGGVFGGAEIDDIADVDNPRDWPHSIAGYLSDPRVARRIVRALRA